MANRLPLRLSCVTLACLACLFALLCVRRPGPKGEPAAARGSWPASVVAYYESQTAPELVWTAARLEEAAGVIADFYGHLAAGRSEQAMALLDQGMDPAYVLDASRYLRRLELLGVGPPELNPDGRTVFFPVVLRLRVVPGAPVIWETGISTYYVRACLADSRPLIAGITTGP